MIEPNQIFFEEELFNEADVWIFPQGSKVTVVMGYSQWPDYQERFENGDCDE